MRRQESIALVGNTAAWSLAARAQQRAVGFLDLAAQSKNPDAFNRGPVDTDHVAGRSIAIELRSMDGQYDRFPQLMADLFSRNVALIDTSHTPAAPAAKAAIASTPIMVSTAAGPVKTGPVASLARPGGNVTGISVFSSKSAAQRPALLRELVPPAATRSWSARPMRRVRSSR